MQPERAFCPRFGSHLWFNDVEAGDHRRKSRAEYEAENPFTAGDME